MKLRHLKVQKRGHDEGGTCKCACLWMSVYVKQEGKSVRGIRII